jgi:hypothetical protein
MPESADRLATYQKSIEDLKAAMAAKSSGDGMFTTWRLISFAAICLTLAYALLDGGISAWFTLVPGTLFAATVIVHETRLAALRREEMKLGFYERGIRRIQGDWHGDGHRGEEFIEDGHLFSGDLNLFGKASLFQKLNMAITAFGRQCLAQWLKNPAELSEIVLRQEAVKELSEDTRLIESFATIEMGEADHLDINVFKNWSLTGKGLYNPVLYFLSLFIGILSIGTLVSWLFVGMSAWPFFICFALDMILVHYYAPHIEKIADGLASKEKNLLLLSKILVILESREYKNAKLAGIIKSIQTDSVKASMRIEQLAGLIYSFENSRANLALQPFNILLHLNLRNAMKIERWRRLAGASIPAWVDAAAEFEALVSLAVFAYENPSYNFP